MAVRVVDLTRGTGGGLVRRYLDGEPRVADALARAGVAVVVFDVGFGEDDLFAAAQRGLDAAAAAVGEPALLVALTSIPDLRDAGALDLAGGRAAFPPLTCAHGIFLGYIALGEGGVLFFAADGQRGGPAPEQVLRALAGLRR